MYHKFYGLKEPAFSIAVNPRFLYMSKQHRDALVHLLYGVKGGGFVMLSGEVGTGKTTIIQRLLKRMPKNTDMAIVLNPMADVKDMLYTICDELGVQYDKKTHPSHNNNSTSLKHITDALYEYLLDNHRNGRNTVLLIDEAQLLSAEVLEQIRLLTNLETTTKKLLQIILVGQPELNVLLSQPRLRQLSQRITARFHLKPLTLEETESYINHRLTVAGGDLVESPFTVSIIKKIHRISGGIPRKINILCERALIGAYGNNKPKIDDKILRLAAQEVIGENEGIAPNPRKEFLLSDKQWAVTAFIFAGILFALLMFSLFKTTISSSDQTATGNEPEPAFSTLDRHINSATLNEKTTQSSYALKNSATQPNTENANTLNNGKVDRTPSNFDNIDINNILFKRKSKAERAYLNYIEEPEKSLNELCVKSTVQVLTCETQNVSTWEKLKELNRPALLTIVSAEKLTFYTVLIGIKADKGLFLNSQQQQVILPLRQMGAQWNGDIFYSWHKPEKFKEALTIGSNNSMVKWVAEKFAIIDNQEKPLTNKRFTRPLQKRVKIFQKRHQLKADGIIGTQTIMKINEETNVDISLVKDF